MYHFLLSIEIETVENPQPNQKISIFEFDFPKKKKKEKTRIIKINTPNQVASFRLVCSDISSLGTKNYGDLVLKNPYVD